MAGSGCTRPPAVLLTRHVNYSEGRATGTGWMGGQRVSSSWQSGTAGVRKKTWDPRAACRQPCSSLSQDEGQGPRTQVPHSQQGAGAVRHGSLGPSLSLGSQQPPASRCQDLGPPLGTGGRLLVRWFAGE